MAGKNRIVIKKATNKQAYIVVKSTNNKTLASTETYKTNQGVQNAVKALKKVVRNAKLVDERKK
ncbi:MAG: DUF1508 domain-containing protein [Patescibacteria group bacterium]